MTGMLTSKRHIVTDDADAVEYCHARGWTDGLLVIPPTPDRVRAMLDAASLDGEHAVVTIAHRAEGIVPEVVRLLLRGQA